MIGMGEEVHHVIFTERWDHIRRHRVVRVFFSERFRWEVVLLADIDQVRSAELELDELDALHGPEGEVSLESSPNFTIVVP